MKREGLFLNVALLLLLGTAMFMGVQSLTAEALVPSIVSVSFHDVGSTTILDVTVNHTPPPAIGPDHYVSNIQIEINGTAQDIAQTPQSTETFSVQYNLGPNSNTYSVRARALCIVHGYSAWSNIVTVPESSTIVLFIALVTLTVVVAKKTVKSSK